MRPRHTDKTPAWIINRFKKVDKQIRELSAARRLEAATIGKGGMTIKDGGSVSSTYPNGATAARFGPYYGDPGSGVGHGMFLNDETGANIFGVVHYPDTGGSVFNASGLDQVVFVGDSTTLYRSDFGAYVDVGPGGATINGGAQGVFVSHSTTAASANCFIDPSDNRIWRSTSSLRYKQDVEDAEVDPGAVLKMQGRTWRDKAEVERDADAETRYVGFIAEELHDLGLGQFVVYDADGDPEAISYDRLSVALLAVIKDQERRLTALESAGDAGEPADA